MNLPELNPEQKKAVTHRDGPLLVLAGAGSGKTRVLAYRAAWLIKERGLDADDVLLLTFTNKAASEMKERVRGLVGKTPSFAGTFHSFCVKVLRRGGEEVGVPGNFLIYDTADQKDTIKEIVEGMNLSTDSYKPSSILHSISDAKNNMITPVVYGETARSDFQEKTFAIYAAYQKKLADIGALDFDDLLLKTVELFEKSPETLSKWQDRIKHVLVDEWQDTNKAQYQLTKLLVGSSGNLTTVGDASQSIYSWRGADYRNVDYLKRDFPRLAVINLEQNYRSTGNILMAANSVITKNTGHPVLKLWTKNSDGERLKLYNAENGFDEADFITNKVRELGGLGLKNSDVAVLYRTNAQSRLLEEALLHRGVPYQII